MKKLLLIVSMIIMLFIFTGCSEPRSYETITAYISGAGDPVVVDVAKVTYVSSTTTVIEGSDGTVYRVHPNDVVIVFTQK